MTAVALGLARFRPGVRVAGVILNRIASPRHEALVRAGMDEAGLTVLGGLEEAEAFASGRSSEVNGTLKISASTSFGRMHVAPHLKPFMQAHPDLAIHLVLSDEFTDIVGGGFDLAIRVTTLQDSTLIARKLCDVRLLLCASPAYLAEAGTPRRPFRSGCDDP